MRILMIVLACVEIALFVAVLAFYLLRLAKSLEHSSANLIKVRDGVHAVQGHTAPVGYVATTLNGQLSVISEELGVLTDLATTATGG